MASSKNNSTSNKILYVDTPGQLGALGRELAQQDAIAFDTEFLWERTYSPRLGLIQVADAERTWLVDPLALSPREMKPLMDVFVSPRTLKVAHAVDQDQMCLHQSYGVVAEPVLDTSVAAAMTGMGDQVGLSTLLHKLLRVDIDKGHSRTNWLKRPLPPEMVRYAAADVAHLTKAADILRKRLVELKREEWAFDLSAKAGDYAKAHFEPLLIARKIADGKRLDATAFGVLGELIAWREDEARRRDLPRRWLAEDKILLKLSMARPGSAAQLEDFRGLGISKRPGGASRVLAAIQRGAQSPPRDYVRENPKRGPTTKESAALVVLRCFLNALAADHKLPLRLLVKNDSMVELLRGNFKDAEALAKSGILEPRAVELVGEDLVAILNGRRGLRLVKGIATQQEA